ncbi:MAG TPA: hypothetical protein VHY48_12795 [Acidobacteriaceae bacterium]|nr:hypothetical protein [Acidobacteriaceae bacterium]
MADNPLLPEHRLRELRAMMLRVRKLDRRREPAGREALLASMLLHLSAGDLLSAAPGDRTLFELAPPPASNGSHHELPPALRLPLCAGAARGLQTAAPDRLVVAYTTPVANEPGWSDAISWAHRDQLPFLLVCADVSQGPPPPRRPRARTSPLTWSTVSQLAGKLHLPLFPVDGGDAVAVFRVMQETTQRARAQGGPSIIWAVLRPGVLPPKEQPLRRLEAYLAARGIPLQE